METKLQEVLWEFTLACNKDCKYCGSKEWIAEALEAGKNLSDTDRLLIASKIASMHPESIDFTGGEPSCLLDNLIECIRTIHYESPETQIKILTNGHLFEEKIWEKFSKSIDDGDSMIYAYGVSINEENDFKTIANVLMSGVDLDKCTMITNFGSHNLQLFDKLARVSHNFNTWQVQLTIGNDLQLDYDDIVLLLNKIQEKKEQGLSIVVADNLNCGNCHAGVRACGVTAFGEVIPCLSMRAWTKDLKVQGNLLQTSFEDIWTNGFVQYRNRTLGQLCCKDVTKIKEVEQMRENDDANFQDYGPKLEEDVFEKYKTNKDKFNFTVLFKKKLCRLL